METSQKRAVIAEKYEILGEGTYGVVYKGRERGVFVSSFPSSSIPKETVNKFLEEEESVPEKELGRLVAIKKFKKSRAGEGISQTACREITLLRELDHRNVVGLRNIHLGHDSSLYLVFDFAEHDLFEIIKYHRDHVNHAGSSPPEATIKSIMYQILQGLHYLHSNWVIHRDIKPSNIMVMGAGPEEGTVKIGDFGLARLFQSPLRPLYENGVVVTIWYRAPELLMGARHYTRAVDMWAVGCIFAELIKNKPLFCGHEVKKPSNAPQYDQLDKIFQILGRPSPDIWPDIVHLPEWKTVQEWRPWPEKLHSEFRDLPRRGEAFDLLSKMLTYDPTKRITALQCLEHPYFKKQPLPSTNVFAVPGTKRPFRYPPRMVKTMKRRESLKPSSRERRPKVSKESDKRRKK